MVDVQIFVVFHKTIFDECYKDIPPDVLSKYFTFIAVNKNIEKTYTPNTYNVVNEWDLPIYDSRFQEQGYHENSAIYHVYANNLYKKYKYIGFFQYDMVFKDNIIDFILQHTSEPTLFSFKRYEFDFCTYETWGELELNYLVIRDYESFFNKTFDRKRMFPLWNTYVIPIESYEKNMKWVAQLHSKLDAWRVYYPIYPIWGHIAGIYERVMAYAIGHEDLRHVELHNVIHDHEYKKRVSN